MTAHDAPSGNRRAFVSIGDARHCFVRGWLLTVAALVFLMVIVGGATRLTGSGLSITEWKPILGAIPPLNAADWAMEFEKYKQSPQYALLNQGMQLGDFQFIYWWEWGHRQLGRLIGLLYAGGLLWVVVRRWVSKRLGISLFVMGLVLGLQGVIGWIMVASGLNPGMIAVAPVKLTLHLGFACLFFMSLIFVATRLTHEAQGTRSPVAPYGLLALVFGQILLGGLVAGSRAGLTYNTWPLMDGAFIPSSAKLFVVTPLIENFVDNPTLVQFNHRMLAYLLVLVAVVWAIHARAVRTPHYRQAVAIAGTSLLQMGLGIATLLLSVPLWAGLAHQALAMVLLAKATRFAAYRVKP